MGRRKRRGLLLLIALVVGISLVLPLLKTPLLIWNTTASLSKGIYRITPAYEKGDIIAFDIPETILPLVRERGWIPDYNRLLKLWWPGQMTPFVCRIMHYE